METLWFKFVCFIFMSASVSGLYSAAFHSCASLPWPITGKAVMRSRAAPMGISVTVSTGSSDFTGLGWSLPTRPSESCFQAGIRLASARSSMGAVSGVNGCAGSGAAAPLHHLERLRRASSHRAPGHNSTAWWGTPPTPARPRCRRSAPTARRSSARRSAGRNPPRPHPCSSPICCTRDLHRQPQLTVSPSFHSRSSTTYESGLAVNLHRLAIDLHRRLRRTSADAQIEREAHRPAPRRPSA